MLIAGLGNPGKEYEHTRHNAGFWCIDSLASCFKANFSLNKSYMAEIASFPFGNETNYILKPLTYMNNSGEAIFKFAEEKGLEPSQILVIEDDINLPTGKIRLRAKGSHGGHNGLKSIISFIGEDFWRLRIGVGLPNKAEANKNEHEKLVSHVLGEISEDERQIFKKITAIIPELAEDWLSGKGILAMNKFNTINFGEN